MARVRAYTSALFFFKQKTAYEMRISDWSSDVCSSDLPAGGRLAGARGRMGFGAGAAARPLALGAARAGAAEEAEQARTLAVLAPAGMGGRRPPQIGRASCRERVCPSV